MAPLAATAGDPLYLLPRDVAWHDIDEEKKTCAADGAALRPMGYDVKIELKYTPAKFEVIEHRPFEPEVDDFEALLPA